METIIIFGILAGIDNLEVVPALGLMGMRRAERFKIALAFGLFEALMPLVGLALGSLAQKVLPVADRIGPVVLIGCAVFIIYMGFREKDLAPYAASGWMIIGLPLSLSLDNLVAGIGLGSIGYPVLFSALIIGLISAIMCLGGLFFGDIVRRHIPRNLELISGGYLIALAITKLV